MRLLGKRLTGTQIQQFRQALHDAFSKQTFEEMLQIQLDRRLEDITPRTGFETEIFNVIQKAEEEEWTDDLLRAARLWRLSNGQLLIFAQQFRLAPITPPDNTLKQALERKVRPDKDYVDVALWREHLSKVEAQVCLIEVKEGSTSDSGTGFLLGANVVMTNYHVVEKVIREQISPTRVTLCFDYKKATDGGTFPVTTYRLAEQDWLIDYSEYSPLDVLVDIGSSVPELDQLDYALIRVAGMPGEDLVGGSGNKNPKASPRGWINIPTEAHELVPDMDLFILQHPDGNPLMLALDTQSIISVNHNKTRVRYRTNTDYGSSGSPCFNKHWELVALHQGGDLNNQPEYNQGIPFAAILNLLEKRSKKTVLGKQQYMEGHTYAKDISPNNTPQNSRFPLHRDNNEDLQPSIPSETHRRRDEQLIIDRKELLNRLSSCSPGIFGKVVFYLDPPDGTISGEGTSQIQKATELIKWAEHADGPGFPKLCEVYFQAVEKKK